MGAIDSGTMDFGSMNFSAIDSGSINFGSGGDDDVATLPGFQTGGRVDRTGIALIHEGEHVYPAPGSSAVISPLHSALGHRVTYTFPVEVEVVGELGEEHLAAVTRYVFDELDTALRGHG